MKAHQSDRLAQFGKFFTFSKLVLSPSRQAFGISSSSKPYAFCTYVCYSFIADNQQHCEIHPMLISVRLSTILFNANVMKTRIPA